MKTINKATSFMIWAFVIMAVTVIYYNEKFYTFGLLLIAVLFFVISLYYIWIDKEQVVENE